MITFREFIQLKEDAPANSVGIPTGISPPAATNATSTNVNVKKKQPMMRRLLKPGEERHSPL